MKLTDFFAKNPVFTGAELKAELKAAGSDNPLTRKNILAHHKAAGHIVAARKDLYVSVPPGFAPTSFAFDPFLVAAKAAEDALIAYHAALELHGNAYSPTTTITYLTQRVRGRSFNFQGTTFKPVTPPPALIRAEGFSHSTTTVDRQGQSVPVTNLERTLVDVMDCPHLGGASWEEIWRSLESIEYFDIDSVLTYCLLLGNATTIAKVGYFLDQHKDALMLEDTQLIPFRQHLPKGRHYMTLGKGHKESGQLVKKWNLIVPTSIIERSWEEPSI